MNTVTIHGNLVRDIEVSVKEGKSFARFTVASNRSKEKGSATDFFNGVLFGASEELASLTKGTFVKVTGTIRLGEYDGKKTVEVIARKIERYEKEAVA